MARTNWTKSYWFGPRIQKPIENPGGVFLGATGIVRSRPQVKKQDEDEEIMIIIAGFLRKIGGGR